MREGVGDEQYRLLVGKRRYLKSVPQPVLYIR
jgi:hypothetical protein